VMVALAESAGAAPARRKTVIISRRNPCCRLEELYPGLREARSKLSAHVGFCHA
jgi:hypothetical protein